MSDVFIYFYFNRTFNELSSAVAFSLPFSCKALSGEEPGQQLYPASGAFRLVIGVLVASLTSPLARTLSL